MSQELFIAAMDELGDPDSKGLSVDLNGERVDCFVVKKNSRISVYKNTCPHTRGPLDWVVDQFLDAENEYIQCANHGALFEITTGLCVYGPCKKQSLSALPFTIRNGHIYLQL